MAALLGGLGLFIIVHLLPEARALRERLRQKLGVNHYLAVFSVLSLAALVLAGVGKAQALRIDLWQPPAFAYQLTFLLMPLALLLLLASLQRCNIKRLTLHPMLWGIALWGLAHLLSNGDRASVILFATLALFALYKQWVLRQRWPELQHPRVSWWRDLGVLLQGIIVTAVLVRWHGWLFGVPLLTG